MPISTFMVPVHPLLVPLVILAALVWTATAFVVPGAEFGIVDNLGEEPRWTVFLIPILLLSIALTIPVISWAALAMGGRLIQAVFIALLLGAMVGDVFTGRADEKWLVLPTAYIVFYLYQLIGGPFRARQLIRHNQAFEQVKLGNLWLDAANKRFEDGDPMKVGTAARVFSPNRNGPGRIMYRLTKEVGENLESISNGLLPKSWWLTKGDGYWLLSMPATGDEPRLSITTKPYRDPFGLVRGELYLTQIDDGATRASLITGNALVTRWPLFNLFYFISIHGKNQRVTCFDQRVFAPLMEGINYGNFPLRGLLIIPDGPQYETEAIDDFEEQIIAMQPSFVEARERFWRAMYAGERYLNHKEDYNLLCEKADQCERIDLLSALDWLRRGREDRLLSEVHAATNLIEKMSPGVWKECRKEMLTAFNTRILSMTWPVNMVLPNGNRPYPKGTPIFGRLATERAGFGLMRDFPYFYMGLFKLSPEFEQVITKMILEARIIGMPLASSLDNLVPRIERGKSS